jgi:hypothetical protein
VEKVAVVQEQELLARLDKATQEAHKTEALSILVLVVVVLAVLVATSQAELLAQVAQE